MFWSQGSNVTESRFRGEFDYSLDDRGRLVVPARFRDSFRAGGFVVLWFNPSLALFTQEGLDAQIADALSTANSTIDRLDIEEFFNSSSYEVELDRQGRILLTNDMKAHASIQQAVSLIGNGNHIRIWSPAVWATHRPQLRARVPELLGRSR